MINTLKKYSKIRRTDREINDDQRIKFILKNSPYGVVATVYQGQPFAQSNIFAYDSEQHAVYLHNSEHGRTPDNIRTNKRVCFTTSQIGRLLPAKKACNFSVEYASVVIFGTANIIQDPDEKVLGLNHLMNKYFTNFEAGKDYPFIEQEQLKGTAVIRIDILEWSAKCNQAAPDFPGAFHFGSENLTQEY